MSTWHWLLLTFSRDILKDWHKWISFKAMTTAKAAFGVTSFFVLRWVLPMISHFGVWARVSSGWLFRREVVMLSIEISKEMTCRMNIDHRVSLLI